MVSNFTVAFITVFLLNGCYCMYIMCFDSVDAYQSSDWHRPGDLVQIGPASRAIDGNNANYWSNGSCSSTGYELSPWWYVDLHARYPVSAVAITNAADEDYCE